MNKSSAPPQLGLTAKVRRFRAHKLLEEGGERRLTLVVAPAGFGKSSLMRQSYEDLIKLRHVAGWLALESDDRDGVHLLLGMLEALSRAHPEAHPKADLGALNAAQLTAVLLTRLQRIRKPVHLFLDDYQFAQSDDNNSIISKLLFARQARALRLHVIARSEPRLPISAMQLAGQLTYLKADDLRFSTAEAQNLFATAGVRLDKGQTERLVQKTEGWAVALQLVRVLLSDGRIGDEMLLEFSGSQVDMARYLADQVFSTLSPAAGSAFAKVAALPYFSIDLAAAILEPDELAGLVESLGTRGLPIAADGLGERQFRLHTVFQEFLLREASSRGLDVKATRRRAALWYFERSNSASAIRHALLGDDAELGASFAERAGGWRLVYAGAQGVLPQFRDLVAMLPEAEARRFPKTFLAISVAAAKSGDLPSSAYYFNLVTEFADRDDATLAREIRLIDTLLALYRDSSVNAVQLSLLERDLHALGLSEPVQRALTYNLLCFQYLERSEFERAVRSGTLAINIFRQAGADFGAMHLYVHVGQARFFRGDIEGATADYERLITDAEAAMGPRCDLAAIGQVLLAEGLSERGLQDGADRILEWALPHLETNDCWFDLLAAAYLTRLRGRMIARDIDGVDAILDQGARTAERRGFARMRRLIDRERMRTLIDFGDIHGARHFAHRHELRPEMAFDIPANQLAFRLRGETPATLWARLWAAEGQFERALEMLKHLEASQERALSTPRRIRLGILAAIADIKAGRPERARSALEPMLLTVPVTDYRAAFLEEGEEFVGFLRQCVQSSSAEGLAIRRLRQLLAPSDLDVHTSAVTTAGNAPPLLTEQEMRTLTLIDNGHSNKEIAQLLDVSENTVKFHARNLFAKLNAHSRTSATSVARALGLLT